MKCYVLEAGKKLNIDNLKREEVNKEVETLLNDVCSRWQVRDLKQRSIASLYEYDDFDTIIEYEPLEPENLVITDGKLVGYYAVHFEITKLVTFSGDESKVRLGDYDYSDYSNGTGKIDRGHITMVHRPDDDTNPYYDEPRFHSQEEYDDYIKWRD